MAAAKQEPSREQSTTIIKTTTMSLTTTSMLATIKMMMMMVMVTVVGVETSSTWISTFKQQLGQLGHRKLQLLPLLLQLETEI